jgi:TalC/MipB family fructose-6-phosphate aldolase
MGEGLRLYADTAVREDAARLLELGIFRGLTTNPLLLARAGLGADDLPGVVEWAVGLGAEEVFCQAWGTTAADLVARGEQLHALAPDVVAVKVPATRAGTGAAAVLAGRGIPVLLTAVYSAPQAVLAAAAGCTYLAPYLGRMSDAGRPAHEETIGMHRLLTAVGATTRLLVASIRTPADVVLLAKEGIGCFALQPPVAEAFFADPLTRAATEEFERAAAASG